VGCGVLATARKGAVDVRGDPQHPANRGKLCVKGNALGETVGLEDRLLYPQVRGERVAWDTAISTVATAFRECIAKHGPDSVAFLRLRAIAHRGLLRRQQAHEGLHRQRQHRHQLAAVHGFRGRRLQARIRRGRGAGEL
jgi:anaerobic selenocysteine-containing dehydrogenase